MAFDDGAANTQTKPKTIGLGGEEGLEHFRRNLRADTGTVVGHTDLDEPLHQRGVDLQTPLHQGRAAHGLQAVEHQVQHHLLQQSPIATHQWQARLQVGVDPGLLRPNLQLEQCERICDQVVDRELTGIFSLRLEMAADLAQDRAGPLRLRLHIIKRALERDHVAEREVVLGHTRVQVHRHQWLVHFMGDGCHHLAQDEPTLLVLHLLRLQVLARLGPLLRTDVDNRTHPALVHTGAIDQWRRVHHGEHVVPIAVADA